MEETAVIGLGAMGLPIAERLAESLPVAVFDPDACRRVRGGPGRRPRGGHGRGRRHRRGRGADRRPHAGPGADALFGPDGAAAGLRPGAVVVLASTVGTAGRGNWPPASASREPSCSTCR